MNAKFKNSLSFKALKNIAEAQKIFLDKPTNSNLQILLEALNEYNQAWIDDATNNRTRASSLELNSYIDLPSGTIKAANKKNSILPERVQQSLQQLLTPKPTPKNTDPKPYSDIRIINKVLNKWTHIINKSNSSDTEINGASESSSIEKSAVSLITAHTYVPYEVLFFLNQNYLTSEAQVSLDPDKPSNLNPKIGLKTPLNYHSIKIACSRIASKGFSPVDENNSSFQRSIKTNRRWYIEQNKVFQDNDSAIAWMENRNKVENLFNYEHLNNYDYDDPRISEYSIFDSSGNLLNCHHKHIPSHKIQGYSAFSMYELESEKMSLKNIYDWINDELLGEVSLSSERHFVNLPGLKFAIFESSYCKTPRQFLEMSKSGISPKWRDVMIYNNDFITLRSFTNDSKHVPKIKESRITDIDYMAWYLSNDMPEMSNQAIRFFKNILDADVLERIKQCRKEKMTDQEITKSLELDILKWQRILTRPSPALSYSEDLDGISGKT